MITVTFLRGIQLYPCPSPWKQRNSSWTKVASPQLWWFLTKAISYLWLRIRFSEVAHSPIFCRVIVLGSEWICSADKRRLINSSQEAQIEIHHPLSVLLILFRLRGLEPITVTSRPREPVFGVREEAGMKCVMETLIIEVTARPTPWCSPQIEMSCPSANF